MQGKCLVVIRRNDSYSTYRAVMSPAILERSGIGRREVLEKAGIHVKLELPGVGENVQDHVYSGTVLSRSSSDILALINLCSHFLRNETWLYVV